MTLAQQVTVVASVLIIGQLAFRAWAAFGGWFYVDDFKFLSASRRSLSLDLLMRPHDDKLMPGGLLIAWLVARAGAFAWPVAAASLVVMQALASIAAWFMLRTLFAARWAVLVPLALYLFSPMTLTAYMWWGAAINLLPMQIAMFLAVGLHVRYLSTGKVRYAALTGLSIAMAMAFYQKSLLIYPVIVLLTLFYFGEGRGFRRLASTFTRWWRGWLVYGVLLAGYLTYTAVKVPSPVSAGGGVDYPGIIGALTFRTFLTTAVGGPWRWATGVLPAAQVDPPLAVIVLSAVLGVAVVAYAALRRTHTWPAWALIAVYVLVDGLLLAGGRGSTAGVLAAAESRYVSDAMPVLVLAIALAYLPLRPAHARSSAPRESPILTVGLPRAAAVVTGLVVAAGCAVSSVQYVGFWHDDFAARRFVDNVTAAERRTGNLDVLDAEVPPSVLLPGLYPFTLPSTFFNASPQVRTHESGTNLRVFDDQGIARIPVINDGVSTPPPVKGSCGSLYSTEPSQKTLHRPRGLTMPLSGPANGFGTWMTIGYLATQDGQVTVTTGDVSTTIPLVRGPNTFFFRPTTTFRKVVFTHLSDDMTLCASSVRIGHLTASDFS